MHLKIGVFRKRLNISQLTIGLDSLLYRLPQRMPYTISFRTQHYSCHEQVMMGSRLTYQCSTAVIARVFMQLEAVQRASKHSTIRATSCASKQSQASRSLAEPISSHQDAELVEIYPDLSCTVPTETLKRLFVMSGVQCPVDSARYLSSESRGRA